MCTRIDINQVIPPDPEMKKIADDLEDETNKKMMTKIGEVAVPLDGRFSSVRTEENAVGNLVSDIFRRAYKADIGYLVGGTIRSDDIYPPGDVTLRDILLMFPFEDPCVVLRMTGQQIWDCLENSVSMVPKQDGRFPHVSGVRLVYDPKLPPNKRLIDVFVTSRGDINEKLDLNAKYTIATRSYLALGKDGYTMFPSAEVVMPEENGHIPSVLLRNFFWKVEVINRMYKQNWGTQAIKDTVTAMGMESFNQGKKIVVAPKIEGRIITVDDLPKWQDKIQLSDLPEEVADFAHIDHKPEILDQ